MKRAPTFLLSILAIAMSVGMAEEKGHMIGPEIITWIEDRLSGGQFVDAGI